MICTWRQQRIRQKDYKRFLGNKIEKRASSSERTYDDEIEKEKKKQRKTYSTSFFLMPHAYYTQTQGKSNWPSQAIIPTERAPPRTAVT